MEDIFADDAEVEDIRRDITEYEVPETIIAARKPAPTTTTTEKQYDFNYIEPRPRSPKQTIDLGDDEVIIKTRKTVAKLDETRLSSGIPKLMTKKIRFKGKGHELEDLSRIVEHYQFWCHELYPRAKFGDCLGIIRKLGKSKSMKSRRREWIDSILPKPDVPEAVETERTDVPVDNIHEEDFDMSDFDDAPMNIIKPVTVVDDADDMDALEAMGVM